MLKDRTPDQLGLADTLWTRDAVADWAARELGVRRTRWLGRLRCTPPCSAAAPV